MFECMRLHRALESQCVLSDSDANTFLAGIEDLTSRTVSAVDCIKLYMSEFKDQFHNSACCPKSYAGSSFEKDLQSLDTDCCSLSDSDRCDELRY